MSYNPMEDISNPYSLCRRGEDGEIYSSDGVSIFKWEWHTNTWIIATMEDGAFATKLRTLAGRKGPPPTLPPLYAR